ncbi:AraC family transcriptional regulator [Trinickia caryophylli]|uniref:Transcriptional regulator, AraC family n=1 Tax=Trinickia caryophylli TaxID=28094 RepID=A0A1X7FUA0_TRICW|nr:AraC family transcriptional regulator [Trinickia caryophylli]PMS11865.1 AraC family transcriptional regulator [Trinickia caryophylli]TRX14059.1 AraC family transcriptional regulator [Trinickia caryophylli]WQE13877.1 AraC family transcriptional regulator [Trinickia caryophylli]SMF58902.1 transcriptional regulator, AraC family [Trinickia caryophylli]GLU33573.1 transcriptional regulator [Trinickia caryophylli]
MAARTRTQAAFPASRSGDDTPDVRIWRAPDLGAELLRGRFHDFSYDVHTHETACFALITAGAIRIRMRGTEFVARQGDLYAIEADEPHAGWPVDEAGWRQRTVYVDTEHLRSLLGARWRYGTGGLKGPIISDAALASLFLDVHHGSETHGEALQREEHYLAFAARLFERHMRGPAGPAEPVREPRAVSVARDFLDHHLDRTVHLDDIAQAAGLPIYRLFRAFERHTGMTPHAYQRQARVRSAIDLIRLGQPLSEVAAAAGFSDQAHLTRAFRRVMGVTPGAYRKAVLA